MRTASRHPVGDAAQTGAEDDGHVGTAIAEPGGNRRGRRRDGFSAGRGHAAASSSCAHPGHQGLLLGPGQERAGEAVEDHPIHLLPRDAELGVCQPVLVGQHDAAHEPAVGAERHVEPVIEVAPHRMFGGALHGVGLQVAGDVDLDRDPAVAHVALELRILAQPGPVADALGVAAMYRLGHGFRAGRFACVHRDPEPAARGNVERLAVDARHPAGLAPGEVERHDAVSPHPHRMLGDLDRGLGRHVPEGAVDDPGADAEVALAPLQAAPLGQNDLVER